MTIYEVITKVIFRRKQSSLENSYNSLKEIQIFHELSQTRSRKIEKLLSKLDYIHRLWWSGIKLWVRNKSRVQVTTKKYSYQVHSSRSKNWFKPYPGWEEENVFTREPKFFKSLYQKIFQYKPINIGLSFLSQ